MNSLNVLSVLALLAGAVIAGCSQVQESPTPALTHTHQEFNFTAQASYEQVFPLFGALEEKKWAEGWEPEFVYPTPAHDQQGMVFARKHGGMSSVWTCTAFDESGGHVQYVYIVADAMVTLIDIHVTKAGATETNVSVVYERTALQSKANEHVGHLAKEDAKSGPEWAEAINGYLANLKAAPTTSK
jgi:hypothetical protein